MTTQPLKPFFHHYCCSHLAMMSLATTPSQPPRRTVIRNKISIGPRPSPPPVLIVLLSSSLSPWLCNAPCGDKGDDVDGKMVEKSMGNILEETWKKDWSSKSWIKMSEDGGMRHRQGGCRRSALEYLLLSLLLSTPRPCCWSLLVIFFPCPYLSLPWFNWFKLTRLTKI